MAYLHCLHAIFKIRGEPIINLYSKAVVIEFIKQNVVIDSTKGFF